jgi:hypothetical protein
MAADFVDYIEVSVAKALHNADRAAMLAGYLSAHPMTKHAGQAARLREALRRALAIRAAIEGAGIALPDLKGFEMRDELPDVNPERMSISQIAFMCGLSRSTVMRRCQRMPGPIGDRYREADRAGTPAIFTLAEAQEILSTGGQVT